MTCTLFFQIISALGSVATFVTFLLLFFKDKNKQAQLDRLAGIVEKLTGIVGSLDAQNETMKLQNELIAQQVDVFRNSLLSKGDDAQAIIQLTMLEKKRLKLSVRPNLWLNGAGYVGYDGELKIDLNNKGEDAKLLSFNLDSEDIVLHSESLPYDLEKGERRYIFARQRGVKHIKDCQYKITVIYQDKLDDKYEVDIDGTGARVRISEPREVL